ncbi:MAG: succinate dehydrogenase, cytochrome b556 subunit [Chloroflexota bacterium]|nr:succinate dehydrogenase, cytochrome b556 subunit [Chloroflexota bacterium]
MALSSGRVSGGYNVTIPGADRLVWYFLRVSGVLLIVLAGGHLFITHYLNVPSDTTFEFVAPRWANPVWRTFDWLLLMAALWHGLLGLRYSITDLIRAPQWRVFSHALLWVVGFIFTGIGTITIFTFDEELAASNTGPLAGQMWIAEAIGYSLYAFAVVTYVSVVALVIWVGRSLLRGGPPIYNGDPGQYAWVLHRATGIGILFFLLVHIIDIMLIGFGRDVYNESVAFYGRTEIIPMEVALVGAVIYHALNGVRIILIDFTGIGYKRERLMFWIVLVLTVVLTAPSLFIILAAHNAAGG